MRIVRRLVHALIIVLTLVVGAAAAAIIVSQTAWFKNWLRVYIVGQAHQYLNGTLSIERLGGNVFFGLQMENIDVSMDGRHVVSVKDVGLDYNVLQLLTRNLSVDNIRLNKPVVYLRREGDTWSLNRLIKKQETEANRSGPARAVSLDDIGISDGTFIVEDPVGTSGVEVPKRFDHLDAKLSFKYEPVRYSIEITHVSFRGSDPAIALNALSGGVSVKDDTVYVEKLALRTAETSLSLEGAVQHYLTTPVFNLEISSDKLSVPELARIVPALAGVQLQPAFNARLAGPLDRLGVEMNVESSAGRLSGKVVADILSPGQSVTGQVSVRHLDLAPILDDPRQKSDITGDARVDLHGAALSNVNALHGSIVLDAPRIAAAGYVAERVHAKARLDGRRISVDGRGAAYGADATAAGRLVLPEGNGPVTYDLRGRARHVDLRRLPRELNAPAVATDVNADYHAVGAGVGRTTLAVRFQDSTVAGARIAPGSTAGLTKNGSAVGYQADATVADLDLQRIGEQFRIPALAQERFKSSLNGHITARGSGATTEDIDITASGTLADSTILGGHISQLTFDTTAAHDTVRVKAIGGFSDFDPAVVTGKPAAKGRVGGTLDVDTTLTHVSGGVTPDSVQASGTVKLGPSSVGGLEISRAVLDADYHDATGDIRTLDVAGRDINVQASGTLALNETGSSNLKVHADSSSLEELGKLVDQPISGIGRLDATVTGNRRELQVAGNVIGDGLKYGENGALALSSDFTARIPELTIADAAVTAKSRATFVTVAGRNINEVEGTTAYRQKQVEFDLTAKEPQRSLGAAGSLIVHPDHHEVHLQKLGLQTAGLTWQLAPGSEAAINYAHDDIAVSNLKLTSGDQRISADGRFGKPADALNVTLENVDLASVDALMLREPRLSGRLNASGAVTGTTEEPHFKGDFKVNQGGFRQFHYDTFGGTVNYTGRGMTLDVTLQQNPTTFITAKGYVPTAVFKAPSAEERAAAHSAVAGAEDRIELHVESTPIDLGLVQGLTTELTNVTGTFQANLDITGSAADPHPTGQVTFDKGAFTIPATGVNYTNVAGKVDLLPDRVHVGAISALDNHFNAITVSGDLAVHEGQVAGVQVNIHTDDFKVIDNKMGNVRVNTDLQIVGELRAPRIEGELGVTTGSVNLDPILAQIGDSAYATTPTEYAANPADANAKTPDAFDTQKAFDALKMNVHVTVPNDLVVKAADLQTTAAPIGLGAINVTLGGDIRATKEPHGQIALVGVVNTIRGNYDFQGRRFEILRDGTVRFTGEPISEMDPVLDIRTQRVIQAVQARVNIRGTLKQPEIVLASTPPLEEADILSLIVFNQPINTLGEGQQASLAQRAAQIATGAVASELARSIGNAINVDTFEISTAPDTGLAELTIGQQLGQNLYVKVQQGIGAQSQTNFVLEYELARWLRLQTNVLQGSTTQQQLFQRMQGSGVDLLFFFSY
jgi:translocation-and-assembly-module (TAM) inner membrane subunit TamB-like protein